MPSGRHSRLAASRIKPYKDEERDLQGNNNPRFGTRDPAKLQEAQKRRDELKEALQKGIEDFQLEKYRKSEESIKAIKNKHVPLKKFYILRLKLIFLYIGKSLLPKAERQTERLA